MRVAFVGKGGAGKSAIAGTFARLVAREGHAVLAVDSDPLPGLSLSLGLGVVDRPIPDEAVQDRAEGADGPRFRLVPGLDALTALERYGVIAPDGVRYLQFGKPSGKGPAIRSQFAFRQIVNELPTDAFNLVGDLPGGTRQPFFGWARFASTILIVVEPTVKSLLSARRLARLAADEDAPERIAVVVNKVRHIDDVDMVRHRTGLEVLAEIPWDESFRAADRAGLAPLDAAPDCAAVHAVASLSRALDADRLASAGSAKGGQR